MARLLNDGIAEAERKHPTRFRGCIHLPIHEPEAAKRELERGINELGLRAVALLACHLDVQLDNPTMTPLYEVIQKHHLPIVIHPQSKPTGSDTLYNLDRCVFRPLETTQAIVRVINSVLPRFPELRFIMPHLGGATSSLKGRMMAFFETDDADIPADMKGYLKTQSEQKKFGLTERFEKLFQSLYFDTAGTGAWHPALAAAFNVTTADRIMFGTDYPLECKTAANVIESVEMIRQAPCSTQEKTAILGKTAAALFKLQLIPKRYYAEPFYVNFESMPLGKALTNFSGSLSKTTAPPVVFLQNWMISLIWSAIPPLPSSTPIIFPSS